MSDAITPPPAARLYTSLAQRSSSFELPREPALPSPADARRTGTPSTPTPPRANAPLIAVPITGVDSTADHAFHISTPTRAVFRGSFEFSRQSPSGSPDQSSGAMTELETKVRILASELAQKTREFEASAHSNSQLSRANQELSKQVAELTRANAEKARKLELIEMKQSDAASETGNDIDDQTLVEQRKPVLVPGLREFEQAALTLQKAYRKRQSSRSSERGGDRDAPGSPRAGIARSMTSLGSPLDRREGNVIRRSTDGGYGRNSFDTPSHANVRRSMDSVRGTDNWRHNDIRKVSTRRSSSISSAGRANDLERSSHEVPSSPTPTSRSSSFEFAHRSDGDGFQMEVDTLSRKARNGDAESIIWELRREISALKSAAEDNQTELWKHQQFAERGRMEVEQLQLRLETETAARRTAEQGMLRLEVQIREIRTLATSVVALWGPQFDGTAPWTGDRAIASREAILALNAKLEDLESNLGLLQLATPKARGAKTAEALLSEGSPGLVELEMPSCLSMPTTPVPSKYGHDGRSLSTATLFDSNAGKVGDSAGRGTSTENTAPELDGRKSELAPTLFSIRDPLIKRTQSIILREFVRRSMDMVDQSPAALAAELAAYEARTKSAPQPLSPPSENKVSKVIDANLDGDTVNPRDARPRGVVEAVIRQSLQLERFPPAVDVQQLQASTMSSDDDDDEEEDDLPGRPSVDYDWDFPESMPPEDGGLISSIKSWWN